MHDGLGSWPTSELVVPMSLLTHHLWSHTLISIFTLYYILFKSPSQTFRVGMPAGSASTEDWTVPDLKHGTRRPKLSARRQLSSCSSRYSADGRWKDGAEP